MRTLLKRPESKKEEKQLRRDFAVLSLFLINITMKMLIKSIIFKNTCITIFQAEHKKHSNLYFSQSIYIANMRRE